MLVNIAPCIEPAGALRLQSFMRQQPDGFGSLDEAANAIRHYRPHPPQALSEESLARSLRYDDGKYRWHWDPHFRVAARPDAPPCALLQPARAA